MESTSCRALSLYGRLMAVCCLSHFITHLGPAHFSSPAWWLAVATIAVSLVVLRTGTLAAQLTLAGVQILHVIADAPFNPDHWLLIFFLHVCLLWSAASQWLRYGQLDAAALFGAVVRFGRPLFLICYGFAALSKFNTHFLHPAESCGTELAEVQLQVSPWLQYVAWPSIAGWVTVVCESWVWLLLLAPRTRRFGILLGLLFHTALVISPGIAVFDFSVTVFTQLFLFTGEGFVDELRRRWDAFPVRQIVESALSWLATPLLILVGSLMVGRSAMGGALYGDPAIGYFTWMVNMSIASVFIYVASVILFPRLPQGLQDWPQSRLLWGHIAVFALALLNGACPYLGLKTQGSFTMFSNLRTEGGQWNHLLVPANVRLVHRYQDDLWQVAQVDDRRLQRDFVDKNYLVPGFELRRAAARNPEMGVTIIDQGRRVVLQPASLDPRVAQSPHWLVQKLLIFRPVTPDGSAYCGN